jgi:Na+/proline symporter
MILIWGMSVYITGNIYTTGALSARGFGLYWRKANTVFAYAALITGALTLTAFLVLSGMNSSLPPSLTWLTNSNYSGLFRVYIVQLRRARHGHRVARVPEGEPAQGHHPAHGEGKLTWNRLT